MLQALTTLRRLELWRLEEDGRPSLTGAVGLDMLLALPKATQLTRLAFTHEDDLLATVGIDVLAQLTHLAELDLR